LFRSPWLDFSCFWCLIPLLFSVVKAPVSSGPWILGPQNIVFSTASLLTPFPQSWTNTLQTPGFFYLRGMNKADFNSPKRQFASFVSFFFSCLLSVMTPVLIAELFGCYLSPPLFFRFFFWLYRPPPPEIPPNPRVPTPNVRSCVLIFWPFPSFSKKILIFRYSFHGCSHNSLRYFVPSYNMGGPLDLQYTHLHFFMLNFRMVIPKWS